MYKNNHLSVKVHQTVISVFQGHQDLVDDFTYFPNYRLFC